MQPIRLLQGINNDLARSSGQRVGVVMRLVWCKLPTNGPRVRQLAGGCKMRLMQNFANIVTLLSCIGQTLSPAVSKKLLSGTAYRIGLLAACGFMTEKKSKTLWPTCDWSISRKIR